MIYRRMTADDIDGVYEVELSALRTLGPIVPLGGS